MIYDPFDAETNIKLVRLLSKLIPGDRFVAPHATREYKAWCIRNGVSCRGMVAACESMPELLGATFYLHDLRHVEYNVGTSRLDEMEIQGIQLAKGDPFGVYHLLILPLMLAYSGDPIEAAKRYVKGVNRVWKSER